MKYLLNSAVVPVGGDGNYNYVTIDKDDAANWLLLYADEFVSRIGHAETARFIESMAPGVSVPTNRDATAMNTGDEALVVRLRYRVQNPGEKSSLNPSPDDYDFSLLVKTR
jgi:hypothetical protein